MKNATFTFKPLDLIILLIVLAVSVYSGLLIYGNRTGKKELVIQAPSGSWIYSLETDQAVEIPGELGTTVILIENGRARITSSPCPNKTCIAAPPISHTGEWNACLPNHVILRVDGGEDDSGIDAVVQ